MLRVPEFGSPSMDVSPQEGFRGGSDIRRLLEMLPAAAYICDAQGLITYFNPRATEVWGRQPKLNDPEDRFCGSFRLFTPEGTPIAHDQCWMGLALRHGRSYDGCEIVIERADGTRATVLAHANPFHDEFGRLTGAVNILIDITERKRSEEALRASETNLRTARDVAEAASRAKDQFLAVLSHELRTPLSPVLMTAAAMEADAQLPPQFRDDVAMIRRNIELETKLIDDLLDLSRVTTGKLRLHMEPVGVHDILRHVLEICDSDLREKRLNVLPQLDAANDRVSGDAARLQQVFWNLVRNATKFTPEGGDVTIRTWNDPSTGQLCVAVTDSGIGIAPDVLPRIFNAFEQGEGRTARQFGGLGLGLAIAKAVVGMHGGTINVASDGLGKGTTFTVRLNPIAARTGASHTASPAPAGTTDNVSSRLLLVDDHEDTANTLARLLKMSGYSVRIACNVADALRLAAAEPFDLVVSDIGLPDGTGYDLMQQVRARHGLAGIALTGYGTEEDIRRSKSVGFVDHVVKPVNLPQLEQVIRRAIGASASTIQGDSHA